MADTRPEPAEVPRTDRDPMEVPGSGPDPTEMPRADEETGLPRKRKRCGTPRILSDTEEHFTFTIPRSGLADNEAIRFAKDGNESWIETVKWAQRNGKKICVRYDEHDVSAAWIDEEVFLLYPPTDLHELP